MAELKKNLTIRIEPELKRQASELFNSLGLDLSTATGIFYRQALQCNGLPFEVKKRTPNKDTIEAMKDAENNKNLNGPFNSLDELMESLNT